VTGDWNGDGTDSIGMVRAAGPNSSRWMLANSTHYGSKNGTITVDHDITLTHATADYFTPVVADWNGDHRSDVGVVQNGHWETRDVLTSGGPTFEFDFGAGVGNLQQYLTW
jgi:hypothetical protein